MKIKDILRKGDTFQSSRKIGTIVWNADYRTEKLAEIELSNAEKQDFANRIGYLQDETLIFKQVNGFGSVQYRNKKISETLNGTKIISAQEWEQDVEFLKEKIRNAYAKDLDHLTMTFLI